MIGDFSKTLRRLTPRIPTRMVTPLRPLPQPYFIGRALDKASVEQQQADTFTYRRADPAQKGEHT